MPRRSSSSRSSNKVSPARTQPQRGTPGTTADAPLRPGSYRSAISAYEAHSDPSVLLTIYAARAHLALTPPAPSAALALLSSLPSTLDTRAVTALANYLDGEKEESVGELDEILAELGEGGLEEGDEGRFVRGVVGTVWILEGEERREEGVEVLREAVELGKDQEWCVFRTLGVSTPDATRC